NDVAGAARGLTGAGPAPGEDDAGGWEWHYLHGLLRTELLSLAHSRPGLDGAVAFTPDGRRLVAVVGGAAPGASGPAELCVWDAGGGALLHTRSVPGPMHR